MFTAIVIMPAFHVWSIQYGLTIYFFLIICIVLRRIVALNLLKLLIVTILKLIVWIELSGRSDVKSVGIDPFLDAYLFLKVLFACSRFAIRVQSRFSSDQLKGLLFSIALITIIHICVGYFLFAPRVLQLIFAHLFFLN